MCFKGLRQTDRQGCEFAFLDLRGGDQDFGGICLIAVKESFKCDCDLGFELFLFVFGSHAQF
jgi:hypothetical protein